MQTSTTKTQYGPKNYAQGLRGIASNKVLSAPATDNARSKSTYFIPAAENADTYAYFALYNYVELRGKIAKDLGMFLQPLIFLALLN